MVGSLVLNRFLIERRIGSGGFGVVYEAWDGRLERPVAVKAIEQRGEAGRRVLREAQAAARLNHPGIVTLYEMGEEDGNALLVTELVEGTTLERLDAAGELSDREIGEIGADLCEALDHAHSRGVVHRDIKPQNVQVTEGATARAIGSRPRSLRRLRPDLPRELTDAVDACLAARPQHRPSLEDLGTTIEDSLDQLPDDREEKARHLLPRLGAIAIAAVLGLWLVAGHGALLP